MAISGFFRRALGEPPRRDARKAYAEAEGADAPALDDEAARRRIELRLARFRLEEASPDGPEVKAAALEVEALERGLASLETLTPSPPPTP